ncbi:Maleylacetate reductase [Sphingobium chlorophenolicum L-1]|uniref:Maleylacetate reductase n=1 Tax=Sphingobium chlorophenolicum L-1 TaxID=690566 RepID=F6F2K6_SPHCR|nr:maleylacetate reductase [Sphingobium chlorophenolicum]AEG50668.1 Maleylacetate reductase [Sphingobium chlorophenolicum L-1]
MDDFIYDGLPSRVIFGRGTVAKLGAEIERMKLKRLLILATPQQVGEAEAIRDSIAGNCAGIFAGATMHTPVDVTEAALKMVASGEVDGTIAVGGGSTTGLGKAIAFRTNLPQIVLPTTYAGSEMTPILGETENGVKTTKRSMAILPEVVIYDVDFTLSLPASLSATSGMNAMAHAVEALYARDSNPITSLMAEEGIRAFASALPRIVEQPDDGDARSDALYGAWLSGVCLGTAGMALHHKLCHVLGGMFNLPHAETHSIILPHAVAYNAEAAPKIGEVFGRAMGGGPAASALFDFAGKLGIARALRDIGMPESGIAAAAEAVSGDPYWNPRPVTHAGVLALLTRAWAGEAPAA